MIVAGRKRVGDFVQDRIAHLIQSVQKRQRARERDHLAFPLAGTKSPPRVVEAKGPVEQAMLFQQISRQMFCFEEVHRSIFPVRLMI